MFQAEGLVLTLRDLFQVVFEMKKKEMTNALKNKELLMDASKVKELAEHVYNGTESQHGNCVSDQSYEVRWHCLIALYHRCVIKPFSSIILYSILLFHCTIKCHPRC